MPDLTPFPPRKWSLSQPTVRHPKNRPVQASLRVWNWRLNPSRRFRSRLPARNCSPEKKLPRNNPCAKKSLHRNRGLFPIGRSGSPSQQRKRRVKPWGLRSSSSRFTMLELPPHLRCRCSVKGCRVPPCAAAGPSPRPSRGLPSLPAAHRGGTWRSDGRAAPRRIGHCGIAPR